jgi:hypothetical protein
MDKTHPVVCLEFDGTVNSLFDNRSNAGDTGRLLFTIHGMLSTPINLDEWIDRRLPSTPIPGYVRGPYRHHKDNLDALAVIFSMLLDAPKVTGLTQKLSEKTNIPRSTLSTWRLNLLHDPTWRPMRYHYPRARRAFTDEQEQELATSIADEYIDAGFLYTDADFKIDALRFYQLIMFRTNEAMGEKELTDDQMRKITAFTACAKLIQAFRARDRLSLRRSSLRRRPKATKAKMEGFVQEVHALLTQFLRERIVNLDETNWKTIPGAFMTWARTNTETVQCHVEDDEKQGVTVIAAVDANGGKLPLTVIGKGKTPRCLAGYRLPLEVHTCFSESGWTTNDVMCEYFAFLRHELFPSGPLIAILDAYSAHRSSQVRNVAQLWEIKLVFIPPGCTDKLQPLDRRVFSVLKSYARQLWRQRYHENHGMKTTREQMAIDLCEAWRRITEGVIQEAWDIYDGEDWVDLITKDEDQEFQEVRDALAFAESCLHPSGETQAVDASEVQAS